MDTDFTSETDDQAAPERAPSARDELHRLVIQAREVLDPAPPAIPVLSDPKVLDAIARRQAKKIRRSPRGAARGRRGYGPATGSPEIVDGPGPGQGRPGLRLSTARQRAGKGTATSSPEAQQGQRKARPEAQDGQGRCRGRYAQGTGGGGHFPSDRSEPAKPPRDPFPRRCPMCRKRKRALKSHDKKTGIREERLLCGPCQRVLRIRERDRRCFSYKPIELDRPAPWCPLCLRRPREGKGTRRGRRRYFRLCAPCLRRDREERGLPAYRGAEGWRRREREEDLGRPRRIRHRRGRRVGPRPDWMSESIFDSDPADRPIAGAAAKKDSSSEAAGAAKEENAVPAHEEGQIKQYAINAQAFWMLAPGAARVHDVKPAHGRRGAGRSNAAKAAASRSSPRDSATRSSTRRTAPKARARPAAIGLHAPTPRSLSASARPRRHRADAAHAPPLRRPAAASRDLMYGSMFVPR